MVCMYYCSISVDHNLICFFYENVRTGPKQNRSIIFQGNVCFQTGTLQAKTATRTLVQQFETNNNTSHPLSFH